MSPLDLASSFGQHKDRTKFTAFIDKNKFYQFKVVPFGLWTSLAAIVKCLQLLSGHEVEGFASGFVDDTLIMTRDEHLQYLDIVFNKFKKAKLVIIVITIR